jgi:sugar (pentulose or hexulose) kinase
MQQSPVTMLVVRGISTEHVELVHPDAIAEHEAWQGTPERRRELRNYLVSVDQRDEQLVATLEECATNAVLHRQTAKKLAHGFAQLYGVDTQKPVYFDTPTTPSTLPDRLQNELFSAMATGVRTVSGVHIVSITPREEALEYILAKENYRKIPGGLYVSQ